MQIKINRVLKGRSSRLYESFVGGQASRTASCSCLAPALAAVPAAQNRLATFDAKPKTII